MNSSFFLLFLFIFKVICIAESSSRPKALLIPISKDASTLQYIAHLSIGTPLKQTSFVLDLGGKQLWMDCENGFKSSTYKPGRCGSAACSFAKANANGCSNCLSSTKPGCNNHTCTLAPENTITKMVAREELATDSVSFKSTDGNFSLASVEIPNFIFSCAHSKLLNGLASNAKGMAGLGRTPTALWNLISSAFGGSLPRKFALCLPATSNANGVLFFGDGPYWFHSNTNRDERFDVASFFRYTTVKLEINPVSTITAPSRGEPSYEYFINVKSLLIAQHITVPINTTLLSINNKGYGGTKLSTTTPYTVFESSIYKAFSETFDDQFGEAARVPPVAPFTKCYSTEVLMRMPVIGLAVPAVDFVFGEDVFWRFYGTNSMVDVDNKTACLAFLDGGPNARTSIVIGAHQMANHLFEFDLSASKLGISSILHWYDAECSNFNF